MTTPPPLTDAELDRLDVLLDRCTDPETGLGNLEMLDGFLSALAVGPVEVELSTLFPAIWGSGEVARRDERQTREAQALIARLAAEIEQRIRHDPADAGDRDALMPLLGLPPESEDGAASSDADDALDGIPADFPFAAAWAAGFLRGAAQFEDAWTTWMDDHPAIDNDLGVITRLAIVDAAQLDAAEMSAEAMLTLDERFDLTYDLPDMLYDMYLQRLHDRRPAPARRADVPGRNDPCVCGSGKKYKKCCADTASA
ncbi:UPF0149 family protein [Luteimonas sp BLCC-B24]|uniref:UPF0149 family protein n=1 Tax=Luteimonas sp. BLCC-B24 TaxID=3025317 RepID=UPI00234DC007|nr:UPF0149 family protein [Luteimonas sp. BLCC-B24]MDC7806792.1 UPF0149 family protein [Luteimonas sp. BLCC-B24]